MSSNEIYPFQRRRVVVCPGYVTAKDGDVHFVGLQQLLLLYGVRAFDEVRIAAVGTDAATLHLHGEDWIFLAPREDGKYFNIHAWDVVGN